MHTSTVLDPAEELKRGLSTNGQKILPTRLLYDEVGSALFNAITALPEYGLTRADLRLLRRCGPFIAESLPDLSTVVELGSGDGTKARLILSAFNNPQLIYSPVDISRSALEACRKQLSEYIVQPIESDFFTGLRTASARRTGNGQLLVLFLGSNLGNFSREEIPAFFSAVRTELQPGDAFLIGADLVKPVEQLLIAYDDPVGVTAAFNRNLLSRVNRDFGANFDARGFEHEARWNPEERRIEMHLRAKADQHVRIPALKLDIIIRCRETIFTESSHKFTMDELLEYSLQSAYSVTATWVDSDWPFAELLLRAE